MGSLVPRKNLFIYSEIMRICQEFRQIFSRNLPFSGVGKLAHCAAPPLPAEPAPLGSRGGPELPGPKVFICPAGTPRPARRHMLRIPRFPTRGKARSLHCSSVPHATRSAGLARGPRAAGPESLLFVQQARHARPVVTCFGSLAFPLARKLAPSAAPPFPTRPAPLGSRGGPELPDPKVFTCPADTQRPAALCPPGTPGWRRRRWRCGSSCRRSPAAPRPPHCRRRR